MVGATKSRVSLHVGKAQSAARNGSYCIHDGMNLNASDYTDAALKSLLGPKDPNEAIEKLQAQLGRRTDIAPALKGKIARFIADIKERVGAEADRRTTTWAESPVPITEAGGTTLIDDPNAIVGATAQITAGRLAGEPDAPPGWLNGVNVRTTSRVVNVDSRFNEEAPADGTAEFTVSLPSTIERAVKMRVLGLFTPSFQWTTGLNIPGQQSERSGVSEDPSSLTNFWIVVIPRGRDDNQNNVQALTFRYTGHGNPYYSTPSKEIYKDPVTGKYEVREVSRESAESTSYYSQTYPPEYPGTTKLMFPGTGAPFDPVSLIYLQFDVPPPPEAQPGVEERKDLLQSAYLFTVDPYRWLACYESDDGDTPLKLSAVLEKHFSNAQFAGAAAANIESGPNPPIAYKPSSFEALMSEASRSLGRRMGFSSIVTASTLPPQENATSLSSTTAIASFYPQAAPVSTGPLYGFLSIDDHCGSSGTTFTPVGVGTSNTGNIVARFSTQDDLAQRISEAGSDSGALSREYFGPVDIKKLTVTLLDDRGEKFQVFGAPWSVLLSFECRYT